MSLHGAYDDQNIFAKILRGEIPSVKVFEDEAVLAIMDAFPQTEGHVLVIPREPARNLLELSAEAASTAITRVQTLARAVAAALEPDGVVITQFNGAPAGQTVFHIHFHIIPRRDGETPGRHSSGEPADRDELEKLAAKIRDKLEG